MNDAPGAESTKRVAKQAVVLVHGMGEQVPMETLRGFVETMWVTDSAIIARETGDPAALGNPVWWKPDPRTGSYELSRITTRAGHCSVSKIEGPRTDFYECYWADLTVANTIAQLEDWFASLLCRWPRQVPPDLIWVWRALWGLTLVFGGLAIYGAITKALGLTIPRWATVALGVSALIYALTHATLLNTFGDVARYVRAKPPNIAARQAIRERGLALLRKLSDTGEYSRIILVGHSLGAIIAYDLIKLLWSERGDARTMDKDDDLFEACKSCEAAGRNLGNGDDLDVYRVAQRKVFAAMQGRGGPNGAWLISDFVTIGNPLTHAQFLLARDEILFDVGKAERRFPTSPPLSEGPDGFLYQPERITQPDMWSAHHAAPFAAVRWTNLYDPARHAVLGDIISGPVQRNFGLGIKDVSVAIRRKSRFVPTRFFTHTLYWTDKGTDATQLEKLREALNLEPRCSRASANLPTQRHRASP